MAHQFESGFFTKLAAWHGLGDVLSEAPRNWEDAWNKSGLTWNVDKYPLSFTPKDNSFPQVTTEEFALVRDSDLSVLGYCKDSYKILQNNEAYQWCQPLIDTELWSFETGGSLRNGQHCWVLLKQDERQVIPGDILKQYLLFTYSHTGKDSATIKPCSIRVVCNNTLQMALTDGGKSHRVLHFSTMPSKLDAIQKFYQKTTEAFSGQFQTFDQLVHTNWDDSKLEEYVDNLFPVDAELTGKWLSRSLARNESAMAMVVDGKASGTMELGIKNTAYGALMGATEFNEFYDQPRIKDRGYRMLFGDGMDFSEKAFELAVEMAN